jgi:hypothetical protein
LNLKNGNFFKTILNKYQLLFKNLIIYKLEEYCE